jgi:hypothetical protein
MPLHLNPFRLYKGRLCLNHGLLVEILRHTQVFWDAYKDLLEINGKRQSDVKELRVVMQKMSLAPNGKKHEGKDRLRALSRIHREFDESIKFLEEMTKSLNMIVKDDETFMYRAAKELERIYLNVRRIEHLPDHLHHQVLHQLHALIDRIAKAQHHAWVVSKAHSRGFTKIGELSILSNRSERRRIREQTIELDHLRNRIEPLAEYVSHLKSFRTQEEIYRFHNNISLLLQDYNKEIADLVNILHEADILIKRTEEMFAEIEKEAESMALYSLKKKVSSHRKLLRSILLNIETQARRECADIDGIVRSLPPAPKPRHQHETGHHQPVQVQARAA